MNPIFLKPLGKLRDLGTARQWLSDWFWMLVCALVFMLAWLAL